MSARVVTSSAELGKKIRSRRLELGFTIEEAARKAGVGTKTWNRYEGGASIRYDKVADICKALVWHRLPEKNPEMSSKFDLSKYTESKNWPKQFAEAYGTTAALSFMIGSDILLDHIQEDLQELASKPKGTHLGELSFSWLADDLPQQFLPEYDYDFIYYFKTQVLRLKEAAERYHVPIIAYTVTEELALYLMMEESHVLMDDIMLESEELADDDGYGDSWEEWPFHIFDDMDVVTFLYSNHYLMPEHTYHFQQWKKEQFYCEDGELTPSRIEEIMRV